jgi:ubiquinone/menaquinone biosynthesis C-methylase UbiE
MKWERADLHKEVSQQYVEGEFLKRYNKKTLEHWYSVYPAIIKEIGNIRDKKVIDIGCGNGSFTNALAQLGAERVIGIDISEEWINYCKKTFSIKNLEFYLADASNLERFEPTSLDVAFLNFVLLHVPKKKKIEKIFSEVYRVLKIEGDFIIGEVHPLALAVNSPIRTTVNFLYKDGSKYQTKVKLIDGTWIEFTNIFWSPQTLFSLLRGAGFDIQKMFIPEYSNEAPKIFQDLKVPQYIVFHCKKI